MFLQRQHVGQRLAGMLQFAEGIDHRDRRVRGHGSNRLVSKGSQHHAINPALQIVGHVAQALASAQSRLRLVNEERHPAQTVDARLKVNRVRNEGFSKNKTICLPVKVPR